MTTQRRRAGTHRWLDKYLALARSAVLTSNTTHAADIKACRRHHIRRVYIYIYIYIHEVDSIGSEEKE